MPWQEREIRWAPLASENFIHDFDPSLSDVDIINAKTAYARDHPNEASVRERINKENIPELRDIEGDVYLSRAERWLVYYRWLPDYIEIVHVADSEGT
jgi:hypothetical protein